MDVEDFRTDNGLGAIVAAVTAKIVRFTSVTFIQLKITQQIIRKLWGHIRMRRKKCAKVTVAGVRIKTDAEAHQA